MADLQALLAKVEQATGPNFQLELEIALAFGQSTTESLGGVITLQDTPPPYTASIDAAVKLVREKLPGQQTFSAYRPARRAFRQRGSSVQLESLNVKCSYACRYLQHLRWLAAPQGGFQSWRIFQPLRSEPQLNPLPKISCVMTPIASHCRDKVPPLRSLNEP